MATVPVLGHMNLLGLHCHQARHIVAPGVVSLPPSLCSWLEHQVTKYFRISPLTQTLSAEQ